MIEPIFRQLSPDLGNLFGYLTIRAACALVFAFTASLLLGPATIRRLTNLKVGQQVRQFQTEETRQFNIHQHKAGTPTMGGLIIILATLCSVILFCSLGNTYVWMVVFVMVGTGALGFVDDYLKVIKRNHKGVSPKTKLAVQSLIGLSLGAFLYFSGSHTAYTLKVVSDGLVASETIRGDACLLFPFFKDFYPFLGIGFLLWVAFVITASSNAVNLTDGLDGLAIGTTITVSLPYVVIAYLASRPDYSSYLYIPHVPQAGELGVFLSALLGAAMGFLWFNAHPAEVFMGDTGSLSLGAVIGAIAILCKHEILLVLIGGIFVIEALSVFLQVGSYRLRGKRILLMSPLHNHFVKQGGHESKIIARFLIISTLLALAGLSTLKIR